MPSARFQRQVAGVRRRLRADAWPLVQAAVAAGLAWFLADTALGHPEPFFAPIAAAVSLSATAGQRGRRAVQMMLGVALGIVLADLVVSGVGTGAGQMALVTVVAMGAAVLVSDSAMFVNQAGASAILVVALHHHHTGSDRLVDALLGGGSALLCSQILFPPEPVRVVERAQSDTLGTLGDALRAAAEMVERGQPADPEETLAITHAVHARLAALSDARRLGADIVRFAPLRWRSRGAVARVQARADRVEVAADSILSLVRAAIRRAGEGGDRTDREALRNLATACAELARRSEREREAPDPIHPVLRQPAPRIPGALGEAFADAAHDLMVV